MVGKTTRIINAIRERPFLFSFIFLLYILINIIVNQIYITFKTLPDLYKGFLIPYLLFNFLIVPFLIALVVILTINKFQDIKQMSGGASGLAAIGIFGGILSGACAGCFVGLFPAFIGLFGISATLNILPFYGLEIQALSAILLVFSAILLSRETVCKVNLKKIN